MAEPQVLTLFVQLSIVLVVARLLGRIASRLGFAPVVGELVTGLVLGASLLGTLAPALYAAVFPVDGTALAPFAAVGLVLLLVLVGVETNLSFIRRRAVGALAATVGGVAILTSIMASPLFRWGLRYVPQEDPSIVGTGTG